MAAWGRMKRWEPFGLLNLIFPVPPPLGLNTKCPALCLGSKVSFSFERQYWSLQGMVPGQSDLDPNPGSTIY